MAWCGARPACVEGADRPGEGSWDGGRVSRVGGLGMT
jgi:hypothetical protein